MRAVVPAALLALVLAGCQGTDGQTGGAEGQDGSVASDGASGTAGGGAASGSDGEAGSGGAGSDGAGSDGAGTSGGSGTDDASQSSDGPGAGDQASELPRGGTELFPHYRLVGYVGYPGSHGMGRLGIGDLDDRVREIEPELGDYAGDREILPVLELIVSIAHPVPGADGSYRTHAPPEMIDEHLEAARRHDAVLLLNIQAGAVDFVDEVETFEKWLAEPDVGVALDPEWAVEPGQVPGQVYGRTTGTELTEVATYLSDLVEEHGLPEKAMVVHQVSKDVIRDEDDFVAQDGVAMIRSVDGIGHPKDKVHTFDVVTKGTSRDIHGGFKIFLEEDAEYGPLMTPEEVLELKPEVEYFMVE